MKKALWQRLTMVLLALPLIASAAFSAAAGQNDEEDDRVVIRSFGGCPEIKIRTESGEPIQWLGRSSRGFLGVELTQLTPELRQHFGVPGDSGIMVGRVVEDSAAAAAGLEVGDIITRIDGEEITSAGGVGRAVRQREGGETIGVELWRDAALQTVDVTLGEQERCAFDLSHLQGLDVEGLGNMGWEISGEVLETLREANWGEALENLRAIDWEKHFEGLQMIDKEHIEEQMERTRERLERIEERLEREHERLQGRERKERERVEREVEREVERAQRDLERAQREREREQRDEDSGSEI